MFVFKTPSLLATLAILTSTASAAFIRRQDAGSCSFDVPIFALPSETNLAIGEHATFNWDTSIFLPNACIIPEIDLETAADQTPVAVLGHNFDPLSGTFSFVVPDVTPGQFFFTFVLNATERIINPVVFNIAD